jgi:hypothetical protein
VNDLKYSNDGQRFLVISGTMQARLYNRDGEEQYVAFPVHIAGCGLRVV